MIREPINLKPILPMKRQTAAEIATLASRYDCTFILESRNVILNAKSMLGLLSMTIPDNGDVTIAADGTDEAAAIAAMKDLLSRLMEE
ncbi:MAG: HPr family phosphocarrier protein [Clostridiales bacterium]|nr:HPr family phosphocarrier protein [Clostridiales bacterium]